MVFLVFFKWSTNFNADGKIAPNLLNLMINMFLKPTALQEGDDLFGGQVSDYQLINIRLVSQGFFLQLYILNFANIALWLIEWQTVGRADWRLPSNR